MVTLLINKNIVYLNKNQEGYRQFVTNFLVKYEVVVTRDFYSSNSRKKNMLKSVKERRELYTDFKDYITFSRGMLSLIPADQYLIDNRSILDGDLVVPEVDQDKIRNSLSSFPLRDDQVIAVTKCLVNKRGIIQLPTGIGKSAIIVSTVKQLLQNNPDAKFLIIAPSLSTVKNIYDSIVSEGISVEIFGHPNKRIELPVTVALVQSLISYYGNYGDSDIKEISGVLYDECLPGNSPILLPDNTYKTIREIYEDDSIEEVMSYNIETEEYEPKKILHKYKSELTEDFSALTYTDPLTHSERNIISTKNHKIYVKGKGYIPAEEVCKNDLIKIDYPFSRSMKSISSLTYAKVKRFKSQIVCAAKYKYNLEVEDNHNYFAQDVLVSNCHHLKCETWNRLNNLVKSAEYSLGFSALAIDKNEIYKTDIRDVSYTTALIAGCSGRVMMHLDLSYYIEKGIIALPKVIRVKCYLDLGDIDESVWTNAYKAGCMSTVRNQKISDITKIFNKYGRKVLILVSEKEHAFLLGQLFMNDGIKYGISFGANKGYVVSGVNINGEPEYENKNSMDVVDMLNRGDLNAVIASQHLDEGVDIKKLDAIILAGGGKSPRRIIQRVGRVLRKSKTGKYAYVIDFTDDGSTVLHRHSNQRLKVYKEVLGVDQFNIAEITTDQLEDKFLLYEGLISTP